MNEPIPVELVNDPRHGQPPEFVPQVVDPNAPPVQDAPEPERPLTISDLIKAKKEARRQGMPTPQMEDINAAVEEKIEQDAQAEGQEPKAEEEEPKAEEPAADPYQLSKDRAEFFHAIEQQLDTGTGAAMQLNYQEHAQAVEALYKAGKPAEAMNLHIGKMIEGLHYQAEISRIDQVLGAVREASENHLLADVATRHPQLHDANIPAFRQFAQEFAKTDPIGRDLIMIPPTDPQRQAFADRLAAAFQQMRVTKYGYTAPMQAPQNAAAPQPGAPALYNTPSTYADGGSSVSSRPAAEAEASEEPQSLSALIRQKRIARRESLGR